MYELLKKAINDNNYNSVSDMRHKIDVFYAVTPSRLNEEQYKELNEMLNLKNETVINDEE